MLDLGVIKLSLKMISCVLVSLHVSLQEQNRGELLSWLMFIATGLGSFSGQSVHLDMQN